MNDDPGSGVEPGAAPVAGREDHWWATVIEALSRMQDRQVAAVPGARRIDLPGVIGMVGPRSWVYVHAPVDPGLLADRVDPVHRAALLLLADTVPTTVDDALQSRGWSLRRPLDLMVGHDIRAPSEIGDITDVTVEPVGVDNAASAQQVCDLAFGSSGDLSSWVRAVDCGGLLARDGSGRGIAVAGWQRAGVGARIENVATAAERRGEGLGAAMTARAVAAAKDAGAEFTFLEATGLGAGVYRRIGFQHVARWRVHHRIAAPQHGG